MQIGFDGKRAYHNQTGLGHYSRTLIHSLAKYYPEHEYFLFNPKPSSLFSFNEKNVHEVKPSSFVYKLFSSAWRSSWVKKDLEKLKIDLYHGLSHEIPVGIQQTKIKSVVTIHDLIHERHPEQYNKVDVQIYNRKFRYACKHADHVIAISEQTKRDIIEFYKTRAEKITVCYQSCNPAFSQTASEEEKARVKKLYQLPEQFFLYVGSIIERKNLLNVCKAVNLLKKEINIPLVVIGDGKEYKLQAKNYIAENNLQNHVIFLSENVAAKSSQSFQSATDFPAIYQSAIAMIYPSFFEGFGIPVLEALCSGLPVITSNVSCLPEAGGEAAYYVNPSNPEEIAAGMKKIFSDNSLAASMKQKGFLHAQKFTQQKCAADIMKVYNGLF